MVCIDFRSLRCAALAVRVDVVSQSPDGEDVAVVAVRDHAVHVEHTRDVLWLNALKEK